MRKWLRELRDFFNGISLSHFKPGPPGRPLRALAHVLITHWESPWEPRLELPQQLLATGLTWYWLTRASPLQELTIASAPRMADDLRVYVEERAQRTYHFMIYGCLAPVALHLPQDEEDFKALKGPIRVWVQQVGDWQVDALWVAPEVLPRLRDLVQSWGFTVD